MNQIKNTLQLGPDKVTNKSKVGSKNNKDVTLEVQESDDINQTAVQKFANHFALGKLPKNEVDRLIEKFNETFETAENKDKIRTKSNNTFTKTPNNAPNETYVENKIEIPAEKSSNPSHDKENQTEFAKRRNKEENNLVAEALNDNLQTIANTNLPQQTNQVVSASVNTSQIKQSTTNTIANQIVQQIQVTNSVLESKQEVRIQFQNNVLPNTEAVISLDGKSVNISFNTTNQSSSKTLTDNLQQLSNSLHSLDSKHSFALSINNGLAGKNLQTANNIATTNIQNQTQSGEIHTRAEALYQSKDQSSNQPNITQNFGTNSQAANGEGRSHNKYFNDQETETEES